MMEKEGNFGPHGHRLGEECLACAGGPPAAPFWMPGTDRRVTLGFFEKDQRFSASSALAFHPPGPHPAEVDARLLHRAT